MATNIPLVFNNCLADNTLSTDPKDIANKLAAHFARNRSKENYPPRFLEIKAEVESKELCINMEDTSDYNCDLTEEEFDSTLRDCDRSSPGPDQI
jgi:hypothetical protein